MTMEWTKRVPYEGGKREALFARVNFVTRFFTRTRLQRIQRVEARVKEDSFPGPSCLTHLCHGYWGARKVDPVCTDGIWIVHASRGDFDAFVDGNKVHFQSEDTLFGSPWHRYRPQSKYDPGCTVTQMTIKPRSFTRDGRLALGSWSRLSKADQQILGKLIADPDTHILSHESVLGPLMRALLEIYELAEYGLEARACALVDRILMELVNALQKAPADRQVVPKRVRDLLRRIESTVDHAWTREEMISLSGCSASVLTQWFRRATGFSPMRYVTHLRVLRARELLDASDRSITDIAHSLDFSSSQRFATVFRRHVGMTPTQYRNRQA